MNAKIIAAIVFSFALLSGCAGLKNVEHQLFMSGQILKVMDNKQVYLCIGTKHGAHIGQELTVYRNTPITSYKPSEYPSNAPKMLFDRKEVGKITIAEIVNEHYSIAKVNSGEIMVNDTVELADHSH